MKLQALCTLHAVLLIWVHAWRGVSAEAVHHSLRLRTRPHYHWSTGNSTDTLEPQAGSSAGARQRAQKEPVPYLGLGLCAQVDLPVRACRGTAGKR